MVALLVELGARVEPSTVGIGVETPLHLAARSGRLDIVHRLLACRLPVSVRTKVRPSHACIHAAVVVILTTSILNEGEVMLH